MSFLPNLILSDPTALSTQLDPTRSGYGVSIGIEFLIMRAWVLANPIHIRTIVISEEKVVTNT